MKRSWLLAGSIFVLLSIVLGAFGSHWLASYWHSERGPEIWSIGTRYQMYMGLGLLLLAAHLELWVRQRWIFGLLCSGTVLFSGSIYVLALCGMPVIRAIAGPLTPIGGLLMMAGWVLVILDVYCTTQNRQKR